MKKTTLELIQNTVKDSLLNGSYEGNVIFRFDFRTNGKLISDTHVGGEKKMLRVLVHGIENLENLVKSRDITTILRHKDMMKYVELSDSAEGQSPAEKYWLVYSAKAVSSYLYAVKQRTGKELYIEELRSFNVSDFLAILAIVEDARREAEEKTKTEIA